MKHKMYVYLSLHNLQSLSQFCDNITNNGDSGAGSMVMTSMILMMIMIIVMTLLVINTMVTFRRCTSCPGWRSLLAILWIKDFTLSTTRC